MILAYVFLLFPSITYGVMYVFFLADELTDFGSISMGIVGFKAVFCTFFSPPVMGKFEYCSIILSNVSQPQLQFSATLELIMYVMNLVDGSLQKFSTYFEQSASISALKNPASFAIKEIVKNCDTLKKS